jgi:hypothetical protein
MIDVNPPERDDLLARLEAVSGINYGPVLRKAAIAEIRSLRAQLAQVTAEREAMRVALGDLLHAVCGETGFAKCVRRDSGTAYPWPALDIAEEKAIRALASKGAHK